MYAENIKLTGRVPDALSPAMANVMYIAAFKTGKELEKFYSDILKTI